MNRLTGWLVLAMGLGLAAGGAYALWQGADIIQVERGWAQVIAGAAALAGGVVTVALAAVLFKLEGVRRVVAAALQPPRLVPAPARPLPAPAPALPVDIPVEGPAAAALPEHVPAPEDHAAAPEPPKTSHLREWGAAGVAGAVAAAAVSHAAAAVSHAAATDAHEDAPPGEPRDEAAGSAEDKEPPPHVAEESNPAPHVDPVAAEPVPAVPHPAEHLAEHEPEPPLAAGLPEHEPVAAPEPAAEASTASLDDSWLDRALAGDFEEPEAPAPPPFRLPPAPPPANVVARYEAGGVAYAMYDDGSIESNDGEMIRRFKTMADLKAHIAGAA